MPDLTQWPTPADVGARMASAGVNLRLTDSELTARVEAAIDQVTTHSVETTQRQWIADTSDTTRLYDGRGTALLEVDDMVSFTEVAVIGIQTAPGYGLSGAVPIVQAGRPITQLVVAVGSAPAYTTVGVWVPYHWVFPAGRQNIAVTGRFGYGPSIPADLWYAIVGEAAGRLAAEAIFQQNGRLSSWAEGDQKESYALTDAALLGWHEEFLRALKFYTRPDGHRLRLWRGPMQ